MPMSGRIDSRRVRVRRLVLDKALVHPSVGACAVLARHVKRLGSVGEPFQHDALSVFLVRVDRWKFVQVTEVRRAHVVNSMPKQPDLVRARRETQPLKHLLGTGGSWQQLLHGCSTTQRDKCLTLG
jgi:hypothetical protein